MQGTARNSVGNRKKSDTSFAVIPFAAHLDAPRHSARLVRYLDFNTVLLGQHQLTVNRKFQPNLKYLPTNRSSQWISALRITYRLGMSIRAGKLPYTLHEIPSAHSEIKANGAESLGMVP